MHFLQKANSFFVKDLTYESVYDRIKSNKRGAYRITEFCFLFLKFAYTFNIVPHPQKRKAPLTRVSFSFVFFIRFSRPLRGRRTKAAPLRSRTLRRGALYVYFEPVEPKPPSPRAVSESSSASSNTTGRYGVMTSCAMRSPCATVRASAE